MRLAGLPCVYCRAMQLTRPEGERSGGDGAPVVWAGMASLLVTYTVWGLQPLYWKALRDIPLMQILSHRIIHSLVLLLVWLALPQALA